MTRLIRTLLSLAALAVVAGGCAQPTVSTQPRAEVAQASGDFSVANSRNGQAIFRAQGLAPGGTVSGTVALTNTGRLPGELGIEQADILDRPGRNGGLLSQAVELAVQDVSNPADATTKFSGRLGELHERRLGSIAPGQVRRYRFTATLPDRGAPPSFRTGDNAYIGSALTVRYTWRASAAAPAPPQVPATAPQVAYRVVLKRLLRRGRLDVVARCDKPCRLIGWAKLPKRPRAKKATVTRRRGVTIRRANKRVRIKIKLTKRSRRALVRHVRRKGKARLRTYLRVSASGTTSRTLSRRVTVRRKPAARRPR
jgi:hypothetical protein